MKNQRTKEGMKKVRMVAFGVLTLISAIGSNALAADPIMTSLTSGAQAPVQIWGGDTATYPLTITRTNNGNMEIYLTASGLPAGATASFSPYPVVFTGGTPSAMATLQLSTAKGMPLGVSSLSVIGTDGASHNSITNTFNLDVTMCSAGVAQMANGCMCLAFSCTPGQNYFVQATTNLTSPVWTTLSTNNPVTNLLVFTDMDSTNYPMRFYRLSVP